MNKKTTKANVSLNSAGVVIQSNTRAGKNVDYSSVAASAKFRLPDDLPDFSNKKSKRQ